MSMPVIQPQPTPQQPAQTSAAALQLVKASLDMLAARLGQALAATVLTTDAQGLTQLRIGELTVAVKLSQPLPAGTMVQVAVQPSPSGTPMLSVQVPAPASPAQTASLPAARPPGPAPMVPPQASPAASPALAAVPTAPAGMPVAAAVQGQVAMPANATQTPLGGSTPAPVPPQPTAPAAPTLPSAPAPQATPVPAAANATPAAVTVAPTPPAANTWPSPTPVPTSVPTGPMPTAPQAGTAAAYPASAATPMPAAPAGATPQLGAAQPIPTVQPPLGTPPSVAPAPGMPRPSSPPAARATATAALPLAQPAQAAARQDSLAPLLQTLGALQPRLNTFPRPVAEAAMQLLALRLPLNRGAPTAEAIRQAVMRSGVFVEPPAAPGAAPQPSVRSALLQLRAGLLALLEGGEIAPVAPVARRPPPPLRDAQPRAIRGEPPAPLPAGDAREAGRTLLHQTDAALSRLKLTQIASQPPEARAVANAGPDFIVELPMVLGHELSIAQLTVQRDGKSKSKPGERGWRLRFAVSFSVIGEVGAQVALLDGMTNIVIWAAEPATADALEAMLPTLAPALEARGLAVGALRVRRGVPEAAAPGTGRLMDEMR